MNKLFADLLASSLPNSNKNEGPRIQQRRGVEIKSAREVKIMRKSSHIVATVLKEINQMVEPGMSTGDLDKYAEKRIKDMGALPSFKQFPDSLLSRSLLCVTKQRIW